MILDATTKSIQALLAGAVATTQLPIFVGYADYTPTTFTPAASDTQTDGTTPVTIIAAPAPATQRQGRFVFIYNADTAPAIVTVRLNNDGTFRNIVKRTLQVGETLSYDGRTWMVLAVGEAHARQHALSSGLDHTGLLTTGQHGSLADGDHTGTLSPLNVRCKGPRPWADVTHPDFGATGNGATDDTTAIQAAINSLSSGGILLLPAGTYKTTSTLTLLDNISVLGAGARVTTIVATALAAGTAAIRATQKKWIRLEGFRLEGATLNAGTKGLYLQGVWHTIMKHLVIGGTAGKGFTDPGILIDTGVGGANFGAYFSTIEDVESSYHTGAVGCGLRIMSSPGDTVVPNNNTIIGGVWNNNAADGIQLWQASKTVMLNVDASFNTGDGIDISAASGAACTLNAVFQGEQAANGGYGLNIGSLAQETQVFGGSRSGNTAGQLNDMSPSTLLLASEGYRSKLGFAIGAGGSTITKHLTATATINFGVPPSVPGQVSAAISVPGAAFGDTVTVGAPVAVPANFILAAYVNAVNSVKVEWTQIAGAAADPDGAGGTYRVDVWKH